MKFLVAIDGSEHALRALNKALELGAALKQAPELVLVNCHMNAVFSPGARLISHEQIESYMDELAEQDLKAARDLLAERGVAYTVAKCHGDVAEHIVKTAGSTGADLIIMGAKGRGSVLDLLMGSIATKVASAAPVSVLLVK